MELSKIGFIGFGEVGTVFIGAMAASGADVVVYDILLEDQERTDALIRRTGEAGCRLGTLREVLLHGDIILSAVTTQAAKKVAETCAPLLRQGQIYVDLNSTSPSVKADIGAVIDGSEADFVEGSILGAVGATGAGTRILMGGRRAQEVADSLSGLGLNASFYSHEIGKASAFKMLRSIFSKGVEILLLEMLVAGRRAGIDGDLWSDISGFMDSRPFEAIGSNWVRSHAVAHERRYYEMLQVVETMREMGVEPVITKGTLAVFKRSLDMEMGDEFREKPNTMDAVIEFLEGRV
jgi:3-hydroxyisobutyrate dehydrogenase-like beta-hydroxyacid dehydrogenase